MPNQCVRSKVVVVGDPAVGKTSLVQMFSSAGQRFPKQYMMTCGAELCVKSVTVPSSEVQVEFHLLDSGGQDVFAEMMPKFWEGAVAVIIVFDVTRQHTLDACNVWYRRVLEAVQRDRLPGAIVANKMDQSERIAVPREAGQQMAQSLGLGYFEASALENEGVDLPYQNLAAQLAEAAVM
jgi:transport family protein 27